jgi:hypothetical protein
VKGAAEADDDGVTTSVSPVMPDLAPFERGVLLANGHEAQVSVARPGDEGDMARFFDALSDTATYYRFVGIRPAVTAAELRASATPALPDHVTLLMRAQGRLIGVGELWRDGGAVAEVAFAVDDAHHHEGVATILLEDLAVIAHACALSTLTAQTLTSNAAMCVVFETAGLDHAQRRNGAMSTIELDVGDLTGLCTAAAARERAARAAAGRGPGRSAAEMLRRARHGRPMRGEALTPPAPPEGEVAP